MSGTITISNVFPPGATVQLAPESAVDSGAPSGKVTKDGTVTFRGLRPGSDWVATCEGVQVRATARTDVAEQPAPDPTPAMPVPTRIVTGARNTVTSRPVATHGDHFAHPAIGVPTPGDPDPEHPRQEDTNGVPQMSDTPTGEALPVETEPKKKPARRAPAKRAKSRAKSKATTSRKRG